MGTVQTIIEELRVLFREGATPSRLMRHIVGRHPDEKNRHALIQDYFREAFGVDLVRGLKPFDDYAHADLRYAFLNQDLLHGMAAKRATWDSGKAPTAGAAPSWLDSLEATDLQELIREAEASGLPELAEGWVKLNPKERSAVCRIIAGFNLRSETVQLLARLVERLQQKVLELESEPRKENEPVTGNSSATR
jgi:hypothetical protein